MGSRMRSFGAFGVLAVLIAVGMVFASGGVAVYTTLYIALASGGCSGASQYCIGNDCSQTGGGEPISTTSGSTNNGPQPGAGPGAGAAGNEPGSGGLEPGSGGLEPGAGGGNNNNGGGNNNPPNANNPPPGGEGDSPPDPNAPACLGGSACAPISSQSACESTTDSATSAQCTWGVPGGAGGAHCAGASGCESNNDQSSCTAASGCNWNAGRRLQAIQWNHRWRQWMAPPGRGISDVGSCGTQQDLSGDSLPGTCPDGCNCHANYTAIAERFNACMQRVAEVRSCPRHVDCAGSMFSHFSRLDDGGLDDFAAMYNDDGQRCVFLDREDFLDDCEARIAYADQRTRFGFLAAVTFSIPAFAWVCVLFEMLFCYGRLVRRAATVSSSSTTTAPAAVDADAIEPKRARVEMLEEKAAKASDVALDIEAKCGEHAVEDGTSVGVAAVQMAAGPADRELMQAAATRAKSALSKDASTVAQNAANAGVDDLKNAAAAGMHPANLGTMTGALGATKRVLGSGISIVERGAGGKGKTAQKLKTCKDSEYMHLAQAVLGEVTELASQYAAFSNPTARYITQPIFLGILITTSSMLTPPLHILAWKKTLIIFNGALSLGYASLAVFALQELFIEQEGPTGVVTFTALPVLTVFNRCQSAALPLLTFAVLVRNSWAQHIVSGGAGGRTSSEAPAKHSSGYKFWLGVYSGASWLIALYTILVLLGLNCGMYRTCARPSCTPSKLPLLNVDASLLTADNPYEMSAGGTAFSAQTRMLVMVPDASSPRGFQEWNWEQRSNLIYALTLRRADSEVVLDVAMWEQTPGSTQRQVSYLDERYSVANRFTPGSLGRCEFTLVAQCMEEYPALAFQDTADPTEFVHYRDDGTFKLVLDTVSGVPACWSADAANGEASGWWFDQMLFGPNIAVGRTRAGDNVMGLVMKNDACDDNNCLKFAADVVYGPGYGRNPLQGTWTLEGASATVNSAMPTSWSSAYYTLEWEIQPHELDRWTSEGGTTTTSETSSDPPPGSGGGGGGGGSNGGNDGGGGNGGGGGGTNGSPPSNGNDPAPSNGGNNNDPPPNNGGNNGG